MSVKEFSLIKTWILLNIIPSWFKRLVVVRYEHETENLRQQLMRREQEREQTKNMWQQKEEVLLETPWKIIHLLVLTLLSTVSLKWKSQIIIEPILILRRWAACSTWSSSAGWRRRRWCRRGCRCRTPTWSGVRRRTTCSCRFAFSILYFPVAYLAVQKRRNKL